MKIYHVCEYCQLVFSTQEVEGADGAIQLNGTCEECAQDIGIIHQGFTSLGQHYYN